MRLLAFALALVLSGCFQISSLLTVRPDGSATLRDEVTLSGLGLRAFQEADDPLNEAAFRSRADSLGPGVTFVSLDLHDDGFSAVYAVADIRTLAYTAPTMPGDTGSGDALAMTFGFAPGDPATLDIRLPKPPPTKPAEPKAPADEAQQAQLLTMVQSMLGEAHMTMAVAVEGDMVDTNAAYSDGATVTLVDLALGPLFKVLADRPDLLAANAPPSLEAVAELLEGVDGVRVQRPGTVRVRFR